MAGPGPTCTWEQDHTVQDGTTCLAESRLPGSIQKQSPAIWKRGEALFEAYERSQVLAPEAILRETGHALGEVLKGLLPGLLEMLVVLAATTSIGAIAGGVIGFFFGGAGAAPGAVIGGEAGLDAGLAVLTWLGVAFLAKAMFEGSGRLWSQLSLGVKHAWEAPEYPPRDYPIQIERAAQELAEAAGILMLLLLQAVVAWVLERAAMGATRSTARTLGATRVVGADAAAETAVAELSAKLRSSRLGSGFADWMEKNWPKLRDDPRLRPTQRSGAIAEDATADTRPSRKSTAPAVEELNRATAEKFMRDNPNRYAPEKIDSFLDGIDPAKPVTIKVLQPGDQILMYARQGAPPGAGSWATYEGVTPDEAGIIGEGRVPITYTVTEPMTVLESTARSYTPGVLDGLGGRGGGLQLCLPDKWIQSVTTKW